VNSCPLCLDVCHDWKGVWWLPGDSDKRMPGILRYNPKNGLTLSLVFFSDSFDTLSSPLPSWQLLYGETDGQKITLFDCFPNSPEPKDIADWMQGNDLHLEIKVRIALINIHCKINVSFRSIEFSIVGLGKWIGMSAAKSASKVADFDSLPDFAVKVKEKDKQVKKEMEREGVYLRVDFSKDLILEEIIKIVRSMQELIAFALDNISKLIWIHLEMSENTHKSSDDEKLLRNVDMLYSPVIFDFHDLKKINFHHVLFTCDNLSFEKIVPCWFYKYKKLETVINMINSLRYIPSDFVESRLLTVVGAAEVLHRRLDIDTKPIPEVEFKKMRENMLKKVPEKYKKRVKATIRNEQTLRDRLLDLTKRLDKEVIGLFIPDVERWAQGATRARNYLAHEGKASKQSLGELVTVIKVTEAIVVLSLLDEIGLSTECQHAIVRNRPRFKRVHSYATKYLVPDAK